MPLRGTDVLGQGLLQLFQGLGQGFNRGYTQAEVGKLLSQLQNQRDPVMTQETTPQGFTFPQASFEPRPRFDERNIGLLNQIAALDPNAINLLAQMQPKGVTVPAGAGYYLQSPGGNLKELVPPRFAPRQEKRTQWPLIKRERVTGAGGDETLLLHYGDPESGEVYSTKEVPFTRPGAGSNITFGGGMSKKDLDAIKKRIATLTKLNQERGQKMREIDAGKYKDAAGKLIESSSPAANLLKEGYLQQIETDEKMIESLNEQIGGRYKAPDRREGQKNEYSTMTREDLIGKAENEDLKAVEELKRRGLIK